MEHSTALVKSVAALILVNVGQPPQARTHTHKHKHKNTHTHTPEDTQETPIPQPNSDQISVPFSKDKILWSDGTKKTHGNLQNCTYYFRKLQRRRHSRVAPCLPQHNINTHHPVRLNGVDITFLAELQSTPVAIFFLLHSLQGPLRIWPPGLVH